MACYYPLKGYRSKSLNPNGKRQIVFSPEKGFSDMPVELPCGQCIGCRLERSRQWAMRCVHEAQLYQDNIFITLTYAPEHLPDDNSLHVEHFQKFMKRFRKEYPYKKIRFFHCGEYGEENGRPHYHAIIFNHDFKDKELIREKHGIRLYHSKKLKELWPFGFNTIGDVTFESAAYVARYVLKKVTGDDAKRHYERTDPNTGEIYQIKPEYTTMSRRPGIGKEWYEKYKNDIYPKDFTTIRGKKLKPPKFYDEQLRKEHEQVYELLKAKRRVKARENKEDNTFDRLVVREKVKKAQIKSLKRKLNEDEI